MTTALQDDLDAIRSLGSEFFAEQMPLARQQTRADHHMWSGASADADRELHLEMAGLGFFSQAAPEAAGGLGLPILASGLISEAAGTELVPGCWLDQLVAVRILGAQGAAAVAPYASGERLAAVAFDIGQAPKLDWDQTAGTLSGIVRRLTFGDEVDRWVLITDSATFVVDPTATGVGALQVDPDIDPLVRSTTVHLDAVQPELVIQHSAETAQSHLSLACGLAAAFSVGGAARVLDLAVSYVKQRQQFGRSIGSFQAIKHRAANAYIEVLHSKALIHSALATEAPGGMQIARLAADRCYRHTCESALQMHGGIGFTSDVPVHLFMKSAQRMRSWPRPVDDDFDAVRTKLRLDEPLNSQDVQ